MDAVIRKESVIDLPSSHRSNQSDEIAAVTICVEIVCHCVSRNLCMFCDLLPGKAPVFGFEQKTAKVTKKLECRDRPFRNRFLNAVKSKTAGSGTVPVCNDVAPRMIFVGRESWECSATVRPVTGRFVQERHLCHPWSKSDLFQPGRFTVMTGVEVVRDGVRWDHRVCQERVQDQKRSEGHQRLAKIPCVRRSGRP